MKILITNDDGFEADGIRALVEELGKDYELTVAAPAEQHSAKSHSVTLFHDLEGEVRSLPLTQQAWAIWGTPADCCYLGVKSIMDEAPDLIISGINDGPNLSIDNIYSGTLAAAMEGTILGIPSMAVSLCKNGKKQLEDYQTPAQVAHRIIDTYLSDPEAASYTLNVNVPPIPYGELKGARVTNFDARRVYDRTLEQVPQEKGRTLFHCTSFALEAKGDSSSSAGDIMAIEEGYVSLSPILLDWVDHERQKTLQSWTVQF